jgi:uncharacterized protein (TIGR02594 family)
MRSIVWATIALLLLAFPAPARAKPPRSVFTAGGAPSCEDRYLHPCDVRGWKFEPQRKTRHTHARHRADYRGDQKTPAAATEDGSPALVAEARRWIGSNPTGKARLWCARFMNFVLERVGLKGTGSDLAMSFRHYGHSISGPKVGAIAVLARRGGGHVGVVSGVDANGNPIIISGNHGRRVGEGIYSRSRVVAYVMP